MRSASIDASAQWRVVPDSAALSPDSARTWAVGARPPDRIEMAEILLATVFLFGAALIVSVVRSSLRTQRLLKALERGERTPELKAVVDAARKRARSRSGIAPSTDLNDGMKKLMAEADELTRQGRFDEAARHRFDREFKEELARWEIRSK